MRETSRYLMGTDLPSWKRVGDELGGSLYIVDGMIAGVHQKSSFRLE